MEEKILYKVLLQIHRNEAVTSAPDNEYIKALATIGIIKMGWDYTLTSFGADLFSSLERKFNKW